MTNHYIDFRNADRIMIIGSNAAENHPISFKWITKAIERGAKLISVDPRFTKSSSKAHIYARIRSGTDIAFIGGMIYWVIQDMEKNPDNYNMDYVKNYTNAALIVNSGIKLPGDVGQNGVFSGFNPETKKYDKATWQYADTTTPATDTTLQDPYCVFQLLKRHYSRYTLDTVSKITGCPKDKLEEVYKTFAESGAKGKAGTILYAMGTTQHTYGTQNIRAYSVLQSLLGNMGIAGGGINALRGTSNVQGSTDMCLLWHILPGYLAAPIDSDTDIEAYLKRARPATITPQGLAGDKSVNWWGNYKKYLVSLLAAWYGSEVQTNPDGCFHRLPKAQNGVLYSHIPMMDAMGAGTIEGLWVWGQNPAVGGPNSNGAREALGKLKWLVVADLWMNETAEFWRRPGVNPASIQTEVIVLPAAGSYEKEGSISNSGRWAQWRYRAVNPPGEAMPDLEIMNLVMLKLKELYETDTDAPNREAITKLIWDYGEEIHSDDVAKEVNGYDLATGKLMGTFVNLKDDGTTSSGNWLYCAQYPEEGKNLCKRRDPVDVSLNQIGLYSNWSWCWPVNRRIIYNRASVDFDGNPWDAEHPVVKWNTATSKWDGDIIDGGGNPLNLSAAGAKNLPFIMKPDGVANAWGRTLADGPIPEVYEPWESPITNLMSGQQTDPCAYISTYMNKQGTVDKYPYVATTYRCTDHWQTGIMTRNLPWLNELTPNMYAEMGEDLADELGIQKGDKVKISSARGEIEAVAVVTKRFQAIEVNGRTVHHIGMLWHWGYSGLSKGDSANILTPNIGDANTQIPESKTFLCNIAKA
jgi:formate dehydrogenase-N alpha subunit